MTGAQGYVFGMSQLEDPSLPPRRKISTAANLPGSALSGTTYARTFSNEFEDRFSHFSNRNDRAAMTHNTAFEPVPMFGT